MLPLAHEVYKQDVVRVTPRTLTYFPKGQGAGEPQASYLVFTLVPSHDGNGHVDGVIIYAADETEQRAREAEHEREQLQLVLDHTPVALLALYEAQTAQAIMMSPKGFHVMQRAHGLHPHEVLARTWFDVALALSCQEAEQLWQTVLENRTSIRTPQVHYTFPDGEQTIWDRTLTPILDKEQPERVLFVLVSAIEITEQVQARQEVEKLDQLKEDFVSFATHELRTPLSAILGNAQLLEKLMRRQIGRLSPEDVERLSLEQELALLERMTQQVSKMNKLIEELLDATRMRGNVFELEYTERVDFVALTRHVVEQFSHVDHQVILTTPEERLVGTADEGRIEQVLKNLISNALNYSPKDKAVVVTVQGHPNHPEEVLITVHDEGQGIAQEEQAHLFDRFYRVPAQGQAKVEGLGLGLYIAHQIVMQHGGHLWLESKPGQGTTFYLSLPLKRPEYSGGEEREEMVR
jgi:signal transduction histidine kinase